MENIVWRNFGATDKPLYQQLYTALVQEIQSGRLCAKEKLPSKRQLAQQLQISVNTVDTAYQMLTAEGYVDAKSKSGFYVRSIVQLPAEKRKAVAKNVASTVPSEAIAYHFETTSIDTTLFPFKTWRRLQRDVLVENAQLLNHGERQGDIELRRVIATYLYEYRGATCEPEQIIVGAGIEYLLGLLAQLFRTETFAVEDPGYARTHRILQNNGVDVSFIPVDDKGMCADALCESTASLAYITPSHQFPSGVTMPVDRRMALLQWTAQGERFLIEDDYDSEFRFDGKPLPSVHGLDQNDRVIYISTFSKSISPAIRIGYMVLPPQLLARYQTEFGFYSSTVSRLEQQTLYEFMHAGHFARHLNRLRNAYRLRRNVLLDALRATFTQEELTITGHHTGLHLLAQVHTGYTQAQLVERAKAQGVLVTGLATYYHDNTPFPPSTVVLGYAGMRPDDIPPAVEQLGKAWR